MKTRCTYETYSTCIKILNNDDDGDGDDDDYDDFDDDDDVKLSNTIGYIFKLA